MRTYTSLSTAKRPALTLGALAAAMLLVAACSADGAKNAACSSSAWIDGLFGETSEDRVEDCGAQPGQAASRTTGNSSAAPSADRIVYDRQSVSSVQSGLYDLGYDPGPADGQMGPKTRSAIMAYQKDSGLPASGKLTAGLVERVKTDAKN